MLEYYAAMNRIELQKIQSVMWKASLKNNPWNAVEKWAKRKAIRDEVNSVEVRCLHEDWSY